MQLIWKTILFIKKIELKPTQHRTYW